MDYVQHKQMYANCKKNNVVSHENGLKEELLVEIPILRQLQRNMDDVGLTFQVSRTSDRQKTSKLGRIGNLSYRTIPNRPGRYVHIGPSRVRSKFRTESSGRLVSGRFEIVPDDIDRQVKSQVSQGESCPSSFSLFPSSRESCVKTPVSAWRGSLPSPGCGEKGGCGSLPGEGRVLRFSAEGRKSGSLPEEEGSLPSPRSGEKGSCGSLPENVSLLPRVSLGVLDKATLLQPVCKDEMNSNVGLVIANKLQSLKMKEFDLESLDAPQRSLKSESIATPYRPPLPVGRHHMPATAGHHLQPPSATTSGHTAGHHLQPPPATTSNYHLRHHRPPPPATAGHHLPPPPATTSATAGHHRRPPPPATAGHHACMHQSATAGHHLCHRRPPPPPPPATTSAGHRQPPPPPPPATTFILHCNHFTSNQTKKNLNFNLGIIPMFNGPAGRHNRVPLVIPNHQTSPTAISLKKGTINIHLKPVVRGAPREGVNQPRGLSSVPVLLIKEGAATVNSLDNPSRHGDRHSVRPPMILGISTTPTLIAILSTYPLNASCKCIQNVEL
ncbi:hypothetical protein M5K25_013041 [Dendrobium thyrsiflorum]|uniref:Uncharacterized protein n=1 Tax=Dendrobium thyrsiflorum TaxID=117978 RepID=A0ABD0V5M6_DENTH